jgi:hypothetical protein
MSEREVTEQQVRQERLGQVDQGAHWLYLATVLAGSIILMLVFIALLDALT